MKDLFSAHAKAYAAFRPTYPQQLFDSLLSLCDEKKLLWDCGTGNGQVAAALAPQFSKVLATDISAQQIEQAPRLANIDYVVASAQNSGLPDQSVDLITVAQALHWFANDGFFNEAKRVLKPNGVLAVWCYSTAQYALPSVAEVVAELYEVELQGCWVPERVLVDELYSSIVVPLSELKFPDFKMSVDWSCDQLIGYLRTWSAVQTAIKKGRADPVAKFEQPLCDAFGDRDKIEVSWLLKPRVFRNL